MSKELGAQIDWPCFREIQSGFIDSGFDSNVYRFGNFVVKVYKNGGLGTAYFRNENRITLYLNLTKKAAEITKKQDLFARFPYSKYERKLFVNPILASRICLGCGLIEAVSPFIPGKNLNMIPYEFDLKELIIVLKKVGQTLEDDLGFKGINIIPANVKLLNDELVVTDLCANTLDLRKA